jgi:hypothetical protein
LLRFFNLRKYSINSQWYRYHLGGIILLAA